METSLNDAAFGGRVIRKKGENKMPEITLTNITKRWGKFFGVDNVSLHIPDNSFITLLGPSGLSLIHI